jgi:hypothetical protein
MHYGYKGGVLMETTTKRIIKFLIIFSLALIFVGVNNAFGGYNVDSDVITEGYFNAFYDLAKGNTAWPIKRVDDNLVIVDGECQSNEWSSSTPIHIAGEWQWNPSYRSQNWLFTGAMDFVAVWRLLYDSRYLYISCEFRDDNHQEGNLRESWTSNDCAEFTFLNVTCRNSTNEQPEDAIVWKAMQVNRKFTETSGLRGKIITAFKREDSSGVIKLSLDTSWVNDVKEGSLELGGIETTAKSWSTKSYTGRWFLEARIPLCNVISVDNEKEIKGQVFKMNLKVYDDDNIANPTTSNPTMGLGFERYSKWYEYGTRSLGDPLPTFIFAGTSNETPLRSMPDFKNLYCGKTTVLYDSLLNDGTAIEQPTVASALYLNISPNPTFGNAFSVTYGSLKSSATFTLYDISGKVIAVENPKNYLGNFTFNIGHNGLNLRSGKYFLRLDSPEYKLIRTLMIVR